jgi:hypothetical protein
MSERRETVLSDYDKTEKTLRKLLMHSSLEFWDMRGGLADLWDSSGETSLNLQHLKAGAYVESLPPKSKPMIKMLVYLGLVESLGTTFIDMALMLLIANGKEMHTRGPYIKHVTSLRELRKLDLAYKLHFLKSYGLPLFQNMVNRELRNDIAHLKFKIDDEGTTRDSKGSLVDIDNVIQTFWKTILDIQTIFDEIGFTKWLSQGKEGVES